MICHSNFSVTSIPHSARKSSYFSTLNALLKCIQISSRYAVLLINQLLSIFHFLKYEDYLKSLHLARIVKLQRIAIICVTTRPVLSTSCCNDKRCNTSSSVYVVLQWQALLHVQSCLRRVAMTSVATRPILSATATVYKVTASGAVYVCRALGVS